MKFLKTFEKFNFSDVEYTRIGRDYFFDSNDFSYKVSISKNEANPLYPYAGFKAKKIGDVDFNFDMGIITNDNVYRVMDTIQEILNYDYDNHDNEGYKFSFTGDKRKSQQRLNLYHRVLGKSWDIEYDDQHNQYFLTKKEHLKAFESYKEEIKDITVEDVNGKLDYVWNPDDNQVWRAIRKKWDQKRDHFEPTHIYHREETSRKNRGGTWGLISLLDSWKNWTDRTKSVIATGDLSYAQGFSMEYYREGSKDYSRVYSVVPLKDEIFVSPAEDFNLEGSFPYFTEITGFDGGWQTQPETSESGRNGLYTYFLTIFRLSQISEEELLNRKVTDETWKRIKDRIGDWTTDVPMIINNSNEKDFSKLIDSLEYIKSNYSEKDGISFLGGRLIRFTAILDFIEQNNIKGYKELFEHLLDPIKNGYRKMKYTEFIKNPKDVEVWFESDCFLIKYSDIERMRSDEVS